MRLCTSLLPIVLGAALVAHANPVTGWVSLFDPQSNSPRFVGTTATTDSPVTTDAHQDCIVANFPAVTLADGDSITLSGTVSLDVTMASSNFRVGLFSGGIPRQDVGNPYVGIYSEAATTGSTGLKYGNGTHPDHPFGSGTVVQSDFLPPGGAVSANTTVTFILTIARDGNTLDVSSSYTDGGSFNTSGSINNLPILNTAPGFSFRFNTAGFLLAGSLNGDQASFSNITVTSSADNPDTDGDGMPDAWEDAYGLNSAVNDAAGNLDNDGLTNIQEYRGPDGTPGTGDETLPNDPDSDDDTILDGPEIAAGTDPNNPDTDGDGLDDNVETDTGNFVDSNNTGTDPLDPDSDGDGTADGLEVINGTDPNDPASNLTDHLLGIDFNRNDALGAPSQSRFRIIAGSATQANNASSYAKTIGGRQVTVSQPGGAKLEFRGANGDSSRDIPGGDTSLAFLVADFIATREGALDITVTKLLTGDYVFRSYLLEPVNGSALGFAQGSSATTPNTIEARVGGLLKGSVHPTTLGSAGLGTTFINDAQVPTLAFPFTHDGVGPLTIRLTATETNGGNSFLLLNGFELFQTSAP